MASGDGYRVYALLDPLLGKLGPSEFGRICQLLLGFALLEAGYEVPTMQLSGRPDIIAKRANAGYAFEVKAQLDYQVSLRQEDITGVTGSGHDPVIAVLTFPDPDTQWIFADARRLAKGVYNKLSLRRYSVRPLETEINSLFARVVDRLRRVLMEGSGTLAHAFEDERKRA